MTDERCFQTKDFAGLLSILERYRVPDTRRSIAQLLSSVLPFVALWALMWFSLRYTYVLTLALAVPTAGFLLRIFVIQHDCGHGTFFKSKTANDRLGFWLGVLTFTPYYHWRRNHALHHASSGDLDRRGNGDVHTLTVDEYLALPRRRRLYYRVFRNPFFLFGPGPLLHFVIRQRFPDCGSPGWERERRNVYLTDLLIVVGVGGLALLLGPRSLLLVHLPVAMIAASVGAWLFFVQHQFPETYWRRSGDWAYSVAGFEGSSYYALPRILQWFTANIGFHHIHHLDSRIPNYRLQECFDENPCMRKVQALTLRQSLSCASLALWDEKKQKMVGFNDIRSVDAPCLR